MMSVTSYDKTRFNQLRDWLKGQSIPEHDDWIITTVLSNEPYVENTMSDEDWYVIVFAPNDKENNFGMFQINFLRQLFESTIDFKKCQLVMNRDKSGLRIEPINVGQKALKDL